MSALETSIVAAVGVAGSLNAQHNTDWWYRHLDDYSITSCLRLHLASDVTGTW